MPPSAAASSSSPLEDITHLLPLLLLSCLTVKSFQGRWHQLRSKLIHLSSSLSSLTTTPSPTQNPLLHHHLLPSLLRTLTTLHSLSDICHLPSPPAGKLLTQSDLDIASSSLSLHLQDLDLLLKSGLLSISNAIVLSNPGPGSSKEDLEFFVKDLFARLQIGGPEFKKESLDRLLELLYEDEKNSVIVAREGNVECLIHLLDCGNHSLVREQAAEAVAILSSASEFSRRLVFEEGALGPLLRLLESGSPVARQRAGAAVEAITSDPENAWAVSAYGGVSALVEACRTGSPAARAHAAGSLANVACFEDARRAMAEEGDGGATVSVLVELIGSGAVAARVSAARCLGILASEGGEDFRCAILSRGGLGRLLQLLKEAATTDLETAEHALLAIHSLSASPSVSRTLSSSSSSSSPSHAFLLQVAEFVKLGNPGCQRVSASLIGNLCLADEMKREMSSCMPYLLKMLESAPKSVQIQEVSTRALVSLLSVKANRRDFVRDEKSLSRVVQMLDPKNEGVVCKKFPILVVMALMAGGSGGGCRKRLAAAGAPQHLQRLVDLEVAGAKKALQRIVGNPIKNIFVRKLERVNHIIT
ncbi:hypothetical protein QJS10_CPA08g00576 [Acorus calamus]|uniref:DUF7032 domain-containing protein n=1 Tax=Acorus calamus TaxID=4465 RepID=A0AAV9EE67_ACOCL|nr:hypothetical protein QJS10_CPA08g00576 [Acorus calamus]